MTPDKQSPPAGFEDTTDRVCDWDGLLEFIRTKPASFLEHLDEKTGTEWLLVVYASGAALMPRALELLEHKCGNYIDRENGGLSPLGEQKFGADPRVALAADRHRGLLQEQNRDRTISGTDVSFADTDSRHHVTIDKLIEHPLNSQIYEEHNDEDDALVRDLELRGQLEPIVVNSDHVVLSGHRRLRALRELGRITALIVVVKVRPEDEEEILLAYNLKRHMSNIERLRVFSRYLEIERKRASARKLGGKELLENFPEGCSKGDARDIAAKHVGLSGRSAEVGLRVLHEIDRRQNRTSPQEIKVVSEALNQSHLAGEKAAVRHGWFSQIPVKKKQVQDTPISDEVAAAFEYTAADLQNSPVAQHLFKSSLPALSRTVGAANPDKITALRRYAQALISLADRLQAQP